METQLSWFEMHFYYARQSCIVTGANPVNGGNAEYELKSLDEMPYYLKEIGTKYTSGLISAYFPDGGGMIKFYGFNE